ncbi:MAG TPA: VOC family protein [Mycobacteriales bacterium]|jgi:catechol 2,3-dioxygenase-like lactoylglutathione lyase family enzyme|nr:VOC family protein [Mycobacteriales bacterium]
MSISVSGVHVTVDDPEAAIAFYRDTLGFEVSNRVDQGEHSWITLTSDAQPGLSIVLSQPHGGRSQEDGDALAALLAKGALNMLQLRADDLDATFDKLAAAPGVEILQEPADQFWGVRDAAVRDPAGNMIRIAQA